jgi:hypothetical protein
VKIIANGSKWLGSSPDSLEVLLDILKKHTLDPRLESRGNFYFPCAEGPVCAFGNFLEVSHVFRIEGTDEELKELKEAIRANQASPVYLKVKGEIDACRARFHAALKACNSKEEERDCATEFMCKCANENSEQYPAAKETHKRLDAEYQKSKREVWQAQDALWEKE